MGLRYRRPQSPTSRRVGAPAPQPVSWTLLVIRRSLSLACLPRRRNSRVGAARQRESDIAPPPVGWARATFGDVCCHTGSAGQTANEEDNTHESNSGDPPHRTVTAPTAFDVACCRWRKCAHGDALHSLLVRVGHWRRHARIACPDGTNRSSSPSSVG